MTSGPRRVEVAPQRLTRWVEGFAARHGDVTWGREDTAYLLSAADGSTARLESWTPALEVAPPPDLVGWAASPSRLGLVLIRRGGYAVGLAEGDRLVAHKCGTRYVQSRTAAGGWSQQRFARRRSNQADALVGSVVDRARSMLVERAGLTAQGRSAKAGGDKPDGLVVGGDKALVREVLAVDRLAALADLPRRAFHDLPDPRLVVLEKALRRARSVQLVLTEPTPGR